MTLTLKFVHETDAARLYEHSDGTREWIPKSVVKSTMKQPAKEGELPIHTLEVEDSWAAKKDY